MWLVLAVLQLGLGLERGLDVGEEIEFQLDPVFNLSWSFPHNYSEIQFTFKVSDRQCAVTSWCAIGLGSCMVDSDMIIAVALSSTQVAVWDMWSATAVTPSNDTSVGGKDNVELVNFTLSDGIQATMVRLLKTGDIRDVNLTIGMPQAFCFAYLNGTAGGFAEHSMAGSGMITIGTTQANSSVVIASEAAYGDNFKTHGIIMGHVWMGVMLLSVIAARYFKHYWMWYWVHVGLGLYTLVMTLIYAVYAYHQDKPLWTFTFNQWLFHNRCGFFVTALVPSQVILGFITRYWTWQGRSLQALSVFRRMHYILGWVLMAVSLVAIYYGLQCFHSSELDNLEWAFPLYVLIIMGFETWRQVLAFWSPRKNLPGLIATPWTEVYKQVRAGKKLVFLDTQILDVSSFISSHPGGSYLLAESIGEDMGKYIYGVNGLEGHHRGFEHPNVVWTYTSLLKIGEVGYHQGVILKNSGPPDHRNMSWTLASKTPLAPNVARFAFSSEDMFINPTPTGLDWIGAHFRVTAGPKGRKFNRYYSLCLFFNQENMQKWIESATQMGLQVSLAGSRRPSQTQTTLDLVVKEYAPFGRMSTHIHSLGPGDPLTITGPMGPGLMLTPDLSGHFVGFGAGTGIMPFLDLVDFIWWKELHSRGSIADPRYACLDKLSFTLYASFMRSEDVIASDLLKHTHTLCSQSPSPRFQLVLLINADFKGKLDEEVKNVLTRQTPERVWVCGPAGFNRWIRKLALESNIKREDIIVM